MEDLASRASNRLKHFNLKDELKALYDISRAVQEADVSEESFEEVLKTVGEIIDFRSASIFLFSKEKGKLDEICTIGHRVDLIDFVEFDMGMGISAWVAQKRRPILLNNLRKSKGGVHTRSFLSAPIVFAREIIGVINLAHDEPDAFVQHDSDILGIVSTLLALLFERIQRKKFEICARTEIESLNEQLKTAKIEMMKIKAAGGSGDISEVFRKQLINPLAIIAGNAQFLLMTTKNSPASVIRRLKAIDKEASNISEIVSRQITGSLTGKGLPFDTDEVCSGE